ncbi:MAG: hypothetical protein WC630_00720 [Candidatus Babeliales bacterium]|jgi:hypothetical protein
MFSFTRNLMALGLICCLSSATATASLPPQVEQAKKILIAEKEQWAYVQKALTDEAQVSPHYQIGNNERWVKHHPAIMILLSLFWGFVAGGNCMGAYLLISTKAFGLDICNTNNNWIALCIGIIILGITSNALTKSFAQSPEWDPAVCQDALKSFLPKWSEHREKVPYTLQGLFDGLYDQQKSNGKLAINDQQAQKLVEGIMALSMVAQIA